MNNNRNITMIIAHPDDEVIFGWMLLNNTKKIISVTSDIDNILYPNWKNRKIALKEVGQLLQIEIICLDNNSMFSVNPDEKRLKSIKSQLQKLIEFENIIFTHNEFGEYGNPDHIWVNNAVRELKSVILVSDINIQSFDKVVGQAIPTPKFDFRYYKQLKKIYQKYNCWTWDKDPFSLAQILKQCIK